MICHWTQKAQFWCFCAKSTFLHFIFNDLFLLIIWCPDRPMVDYTCRNKNAAFLFSYIFFCAYHARIREICQAKNLPNTCLVMQKKNVFIKIVSSNILHVYFSRLAWIRPSTSRVSFYPRATQCRGIYKWLCCCFWVFTSMARCLRVMTYICSLVWQSLLCCCPIQCWKSILTHTFCNQNAKHSRYGICILVTFTFTYESVEGEWEK